MTQRQPKRHEGSWADRPASSAPCPVSMPQHQRQVAIKHDWRRCRCSRCRWRGCGRWRRRGGRRRRRRSSGRRRPGSSGRRRSRRRGCRRCRGRSRRRVGGCRCRRRIARRELGWDVGRAIDQQHGIQARSGSRLLNTMLCRPAVRANGVNRLALDMHRLPAPGPLAPKLANLVLEGRRTIHRDPEGILVPIQAHGARPQVVTACVGHGDVERDAASLTSRVVHVSAGRGARGVRAEQHATVRGAFSASRCQSHWTASYS